MREKFNLFEQQGGNPLDLKIVVKRAPWGWRDEQGLSRPRWTAYAVDQTTKTDAFTCGHSHPRQCGARDCARMMKTILYGFRYLPT